MNLTRKIGLLAATVAAAGGLALAGASAASAAPAPFSVLNSCAQAHPGFTGTWQDVNNGQYLGASGNPQRPDSSSTVKFGPQSGTETTNCFNMTHPGYSDNGALVQWINGGRNHFGKYLACTPGSAALAFVNIPSADGGFTDWVYDGTGFTCMGRYLVLSKTGGVIGSAHTSANPADESETTFVDASTF